MRKHDIWHPTRFEASPSEFHGLLHHRPEVIDFFHRSSNIPVLFARDKGQIQHQLSYLEFFEKDRGLCFHYDQPLSLNHRYPNKTIQFMVLQEELACV